MFSIFSHTNQSNGWQMQTEPGDRVDGAGRRPSGRRVLSGMHSTKPVLRLLRQPSPRVHSNRHERHFRVGGEGQLRELKL